MLASNARRAAAVAVIGLAALSNPFVAALAQTAAKPAGSGTVVGTGAVTSFVENMDRSLAFYHDAFGMEVPALPDTGARPYNPSNSQLYAMFDIAGAKERHQSARIPDTNVRLELMEVQNVEHKTLALRIQDPGAMTLVFSVRDVAHVLERAKQASATVVTPGGAPVRSGDGGKSVLIKDPDGRFIELREPAAQNSAQTGTTAAGGPDLTAMRISIAVNDMTKTLKIYRDLLGFTVEADEKLGANKELRSLTGLPKAEFRRAVVVGPSAKPLLGPNAQPMRIEFVEYRGVDRKPLEMRIQDRGAARMQLRAENLEALVAKMHGAGLRVVSKGGGPVPIPPNFMGALVADPNNFFLTPIAPCDGCAPRLVSEAH
jgi:catechol 2,3-dioxygenase-like lactoylglutathione lyase family enzyme